MVDPVKSKYCFPNFLICGCKCKEKKPENKAKKLARHINRSNTVREISSARPKPTHRKLDSTGVFDYFDMKELEKDKEKEKGKK